MKINGVDTTSIVSVNGTLLSTISSIMGITLPTTTTTTTTSNPYTTATGGTVTTDGDYKIHTFTTAGSTNFVVSNVGSSPNNTIQVLMVAGGGGTLGRWDLVTCT